MPKNRNRTVTNSFEFPPEFLKTLPYPEKINNTKSGQKLNATSINPLDFGEPIPPQHVYKININSKPEAHHSSSSSEHDNITSGFSDIDIVSFGKSSSSSVSWSEEFDAEATQHVQNEFDRMERVLQGKEPIPPHYNRDEYKQWIKTFPQLSISGSKMKYPVRHNRENITQHHDQEEVIAFHSDISCLIGDCDSNPTSKELETINDIKNSVIDKVFKEVSTKFLEKNNSNKINSNVKSKSRKCVENQKSEQLNSNELVNEFDSFLRISPVLLQESPKRSYYLETRQQSSHSVSRSEKLASRWMREESLEYSSLPYISTASAKNKSLKTIRHKNLTSSKSRYSTKNNNNSNKNNYVSLPPIKTLSLPLGNQYRSISATPRQPPKGLSAISIQPESLLGTKKSRFKVANNYLVQNDIDKRKKIVKHS